MSLKDNIAANNARRANDPEAAQRQAQTAQTQASTVNTQTTTQGKEVDLKTQGAQNAATLANAQQQHSTDMWKYIDGLHEQYTKTDAFKQYDAIIPTLAGALRSGPDSMSDVDLTYAAAKIFDPGSVVRGEEQESFKAAQAALESKRQEIMKQFGYDNGVFTPENRAKLRAALVRRAQMANKAINRVRLEYKKKATDRGLPVDQVIGTHPGSPFMDDLKAYDDSLKVKDARQRASVAVADEHGKPPQNLVEPDAPLGPTYDEQQRARVGLLDTPPENMQVAGEMIHSPRLDAQREHDVNLVTSAPTSTPEDAAKAIAQAHIDQGLATEAQRQEVYDRNLPATQKWYKDLTPEQRAAAKGIDYQEADKQATLDAPLTEQIKLAGSNVGESAANLIGSTMMIPKDIVMSAVKGEPQGAVNAVAHPLDTLDALSRKYTDSDEFKLSLMTDPLAIPGDVAGVLSGGGGLLRGAGALTRGSRAGAVASSLGRRLERLGGWVDPVTLGGKTMGYMADPGGPVSRATGRLGSYLLGGMTGVGDVPVRLGADAGWQAGRHGDAAALDAFNANRVRPGEEAPRTVDLAQDALNNFDRSEKRAYTSASDPFFNATAGDTLDLTGVRAQLDAAMPERYRQMEHLPDGQRPGSHREWQRASDALDHQIALGTVDPTNLNPRNLDAFKRDAREVTATDPGDPSYRAAIADIMPNDVRDVISYRYPTEYPSIMERYGNFLNNRRAFRDTFGLGETPNAPINVENTGRKLGSSLRSNVNTNYGQRTTMLEQLATHGAPALPHALAGQAMSSVLPRGIQGALFGSGATALGAGIATGASLATLPISLGLSSPRLVGRLVSGGAQSLGAGARHMDEVVSALDAPLTTRFPSLNRPPSELYNAVRPAMDVGDMLERGGSQVDLDELERLRREYMLQGMPLPEDLPGYAKGGPVRRLAAKYACGGPVRQRR